MAVPGTGSTNQSLTISAFKKLAGKAHTSNLKEFYEETIPSNVQIKTDIVFGEAIPQTVTTSTLYTRFSASASDPETVEYVEFTVESISGTTYDANDGTFGDVGFGGGDEAQSGGPHGYKLSLRSFYQASSSFSGKGSSPFVNSQTINETNGALQLVHPSFGPQAGNNYGLSLYTDHPDNGGSLIVPTNAIDWYIDYFNGIVFIQDYRADFVPTYARGFIYIGKFASTLISEASSSGGGITDIVNDTTPQLGGDLDVNGNDIVSVSNGNINLLPNGVGKVIMDGNGSTGGISVVDGTIEMRSGNGSPAEIKMYCEVNNAHYVRFAAPPHANFSGNPDFVLPSTEGVNGQFLKTDGSGNTSWADSVSYGRTNVATHTTSSTSARILGVNATASLEIRLPAASGFSAGQHFTIKDEAGNANSNNIIVKTTGADTIDGFSSITLESPYAAVNIYSNGSNKFFIY